MKTVYGSNVSIRDASNPYKKTDPSENPDIAFVFTENAQAYAATTPSMRGGDKLLSTASPETVKINVSDMAGTKTPNTAGIRSIDGKTKQPNVFGIVVKKYQQLNGINSKFVAKEGQFNDTDSDFMLFQAFNRDFFEKLQLSKKKEIIMPSSIALGRSALPLRFAEWLQKEIKNRLGVDYSITKTETAGYDGYGLKFNSEINIESQLPTPQQVKDYSEKNKPLFSLSTNNIKPGVSELFESNPELANAVYEALGTKKDALSMPSMFPKKNWSIGHIIDTPEDASRICQITQMKVFSYLSDNFKKSDGKEVAKPVMIWTKSPLNDEQILHWTVAVKIDGKLYLYDMPQSEFIEKINDNSGRVISKYNPRLIEFTKENFMSLYGTSERLAEVNMSDEDLIDEVPELPISKITPQQKQQAQQLYSQYLDTIFPDSKVKDIVYRGSNDELLFLGKDFGGEIYFSPIAEAVKGYQEEHGKLYTAIINTLNPYLAKKQYETQERIPTGYDSVLNYVPERIDLKGFNYTDRVLEFIEKHEKEYTSFEELRNAAFKYASNTVFEEEYGKGNEIGIHHQSIENVLPEIKVKTKEQIHILGSKQDIEGFKEFVSNSNNTSLEQT